MLIISCLLAYLNYLIPNKSLLFKNFIGTFEKTFLVLIDLFGYLSQLILVIFIFAEIIGPVTPFPFKERLKSFFLNHSLWLKSSLACQGNT